MNEPVLKSEWQQLFDRAVELETENERLINLIDEHNKAVVSACKWMQENRGCSDYIDRGRRCPDCPRDWEIEKKTPEGLAPPPGVV